MPRPTRRTFLTMARAAAELADRNPCRANDRLCTQAVWLIQTMLLGSRADMHDIVSAVRKIQAAGGPSRESSGKRRTGEVCCR